MLLKNPLQIPSYGDYLTKRIRGEYRFFGKTLNLAVDELEIDYSSTTEISLYLQPNLKHDYDNLFPLLDQKVRDAIVAFISITTRAHLEMNEAFSLLSARERAFLKHYFSEMLLMDKIVFSEGMSPQRSGLHPKHL